jgi:hypothetical protein
MEFRSIRVGYADNATNDSDASNIDISWAVDKNGKYVKLPGIDFVKVYSAIRQENECWRSKYRSYGCL